MDTQLFIADVIDHMIDYGECPRVYEFEDFGCDGEGDCRECWLDVFENQIEIVRRTKKGKQDDSKNS